VVTELASAQQLADPDAPPELQIVGATEPVESEIERADARSVIAMVFGDEGRKLYVPNEAQDYGMSKRYAFWKIEDVPDRIPQFSDPGIREAVLAAWKREKARPLAEERAKALAEVVKQSAEGMLQALAGQTVTGAAGAEPLSVRETEQFSWLRQSAAPQLNFMAPPPPPQVSPISAIDHASNDTMNTLFNELNDGEVGVVSNADKSAYYVVMVKNRNPSTPGGEEVMRQAFLRENLFPFGGFGGFGMTPYATVMGEEQSAAYMRWSQSIERMYGLKMNLPEPEAL
jgi:hypothetical protein